jgi:20S proteasome alpha/beta subunit
MTIVAGFRVKDGIVLCGDTMYTGGMKIHQPKLCSATLADSPDSVDRLSIAFALAGNEANARMAIEDCLEGINEIPTEKRNLRNITKSIRSAVLKINRDYVDGHSEAEKYGLQFGLIIGAWVPRGGYRLWATAGSGIISQEAYYCQGTGEYLGHYLIRPMFKMSMSITETVLLAIQTIAAVKKYDPNCGGDTQFVTITEGGALSAEVPYSALGVEGHIESFERMCRQLLFDVADKNLDAAGFDLKLGAFIGYTKALRESFAGRGFNYIVEVLKKAAEKASMQLNPQPTTGGQSPQPPSPESPEESGES